MSKAKDLDSLVTELENSNMQIKLLEQEIKELNKQNYQLMTRICELSAQGEDDTEP